MWPGFVFKAVRKQISPSVRGVRSESPIFGGKTEGNQNGLTVIPARLLALKPTTHVLYNGGVWGKGFPRSSGHQANLEIIEVVTVKQSL